VERFKNRRDLVREIHGEMTLAIGELDLHRKNLVEKPQMDTNKHRRSESIAKHQCASKITANEPLLCLKRAGSPFNFPHQPK
jgi:hypothetical protein